MCVSMCVHACASVRIIYLQPISRVFVDLAASHRVCIGVAFLMYEVRGGFLLARVPSRLVSLLEIRNEMRIIGEVESESCHALLSRAMQSKHRHKH
jgi:hypothetical protein